jgi:tetratricopeptide (TPR) repeat protein
VPRSRRPARRTRLACLTLAACLAGSLLGRARPAFAKDKDGDDGLPPSSTITDYYGELERLGLIDKNTGSPEALAAELTHAEASLEAGDPVGAAVLLYALVESPRFTDFSDSPEYQNAEYDLAVALLGSGAYDASLAYLGRVLARGPGALYFAAAHRRAVDIALETRDFTGVLAKLEAVKLNEPLPVEATAERAYLRARTAYEKGQLDAAEGELTKLSRKSRLYTSALYLRGVIRARKGEFADAVTAFCEIVSTPDDDRFSFYVDSRYFTIKDLARLGLGRIAHEQDRYDDAYYHYFQIPDDSDRLPEALFEAAWSMYQKRELDTARDLTAEFLKSFPDSPLQPEAQLLGAYIELADCKFEAAEARFDAIVKDLQPVVNAAAEIRKSQARRRTLFEGAMDREREKRHDPEAAAARAHARTPEERVLVMLRLDPRFVRLNEAATGLRQEAADAPHVAAAWRQLGARLASGGGKVAKIAVDATPEEKKARKAAELLEDVRRLRLEIRREKAAIDEAVRGKRIKGDVAAERLGELDAADGELARMEASAEAASEHADKVLLDKADPRLRQMIEADLARARALARVAADFARGIDDAADKIAARALAGLYVDLRRVLDKAKLGKIDAVIGTKRKLEIEVEDLALGRFPPELFGRLYEEGMIGDDEVFWPPDAELWKDEYSGWR